MDIKKTFLKLTQHTYPHGYEIRLKHLLPNGIEVDKYGNYFLKIGDSDTMFTCHLDTCSPRFEKVTHVVKGQFIHTNNRTILGADDKAGMVILLYMIENKVPGLYYFFLGEEVGGIGSHDAAKLDFSSYKKCISFDRRGYDSVITDQYYGICCSDSFATELSNRLNLTNTSFKFRPDPTGIFTDSASFVNSIPECTNISVGYFNEHTTHEMQDISFLSKLCESVVKIDWATLPIVRAIGATEIFYVNKEKKKYDFYDWRPDFETPKTSSGDDDQSAILTIWVGDKRWKAKLTNKRISIERNLIYNWVIKQCHYSDITSILWDGKSCTVESKNSTDYLGERDEMIHVISGLDYIPLECLNLIKRC